MRAGETRGPQPAPALPLAGLRVIAIEQYGAGPYGSMYLADLGAEVIKIENPATSGDVARATGPYHLGDTDSLFFQFFNQNKSSLALDMKSAKGREIFERLVQTADVVLNNLRGDQPTKLAITYTDLKQINPRIVCAHLSAYGRGNDRETWPGYDYLMQAEAGFLHLTGEPDGPPTRFGLSVVDFLTGLVASVGILSSVWGAARSGLGRDVDVSLFDVAMHQLSYPGIYYLNEEAVTSRVEHSGHPSVVPCQLYPTADGSIFLMIMSGPFWEKMTTRIGDDRLFDDEKYGTLDRRQRNKAELNALLDAIFAERRSDEWVTLLGGAVPIAPVHRLDAALENAFVRNRGGVQTYRHREKGEIATISNPILLDGERLAATGAPQLGRDTGRLLAELGLSQSEIAQLRRDGVVLATTSAGASA